MRLPADRYAPPRPPVVQRRTDLVDRDGLEEVQCELDYAAATKPPDNAVGRLLLQGTIAALVATAFAWGIGNCLLPLAWLYLPVHYIVGGVLIAAIGTAALLATTWEETAIRALKNVWIVVWAMAAVLATPFLLTPQVAGLWLLLIAMPPCIHFSYRFTTFGVHWITGHPRGDGTIMHQCRELWRYRYEGVSTAVPDDLRDAPRDAMCWRKMTLAVRGHDYGVLWCYGAVLAGIAIGWFTRNNTPTAAIGLQSSVAILLVLAAAAFIRCDGRLPLRVLGKILLRWCFDNANGQTTPWMFQSPCGETLTRSAWAKAVVGLVAVAINNLAGGYVLLVVSLSHRLAIFWPEWTQPLLAVSMVAVLGVAVPLTAITLLLSIIAGPALKAFNELYSE